MNFRQESNPTIMTTIVPRQFDNASEFSSRLENERQGNSFIDTANEKEILDWSDSNEDDEVEEAYDVDRVEDEDWEIAERGVYSSSLDVEY